MNEEEIFWFKKHIENKKVWDIQAKGFSQWLRVALFPPLRLLRIVHIYDKQ